MMIKTTHDSETPAHNQQVITACALIHRKIRGVEGIFLAKRASTKKFLPSVFEIPGGHINFGEDLITGLKREIKEEFAMDITVGDSFFAFSYINKIKRSHSIQVVFFAKFSIPINKIRLNPEDHSEYIWLAEEEMDNILGPDKKNDEHNAIRKAFKLLKGDEVSTG